MAIISFNYNPNSVQAQKAIEYMLSTGVFKVTETPIQKHIRKTIESTEKIADDIRKNGIGAYKTLDDLIEELKAEDEG